MADTERGDVPAEITLPAGTMAALMDDPELLRGVEAARAEGGTAGVIAFLNTHGLRWRVGGSDPAAAFADALEHGGLEFSGPLVETIRPDVVQVPRDLVDDRRKATRKAQRKARRAQRRR